MFFFSSRRRHTRSYGDWSSDVCSSDLAPPITSGPYTLGVGSVTLGDVTGSGVIFIGPALQGNVTLQGVGQSAQAALPKIGRASCRERGQTVRGPATLR